MKKSALLVLLIAIISSCTPSKSTKNPYDNYGKAHNEIVNGIFEKAKSQLSKESTTEEILKFVSNETKKSLNDDNFLKKYDLTKNSKDVDNVLNEFTSKPALFAVGVCKSCPDFEKLMKMMPTFPEYKDIFTVLTKSDDEDDDTPEKIISKLNNIEKEAMTMEGSNKKNRKLLLLAIGKNSINLTDKLTKQGSISCCNWKDVGASDCGGALAGAPLVGVGALGGAALFSSVNLIGQYFKW